MFKSEPSLIDTSYEIKIHGELDVHWSSWFNGVMIFSEQAVDDDQETTLRVRVSDQANLRGILNKIWDLNLTIISVVRIADTQG